MEVDDEVVFFLGEAASFEVRSEVIDPSETAALAATEKSGGFRKGSPATFAMSVDVSFEPFVFLFGPCSFVRVAFLTTW